MPGTVRQRMIEGAHVLLAQRGLQATSFAEVTQATQTPRGSIYHHFPQGKQELVLAALDFGAERFSAFLATLPRTTPGALTADFFHSLRVHLERTDYSSGSAVCAVVVAAENPEQLDRCDHIIQTYCDELAAALGDCGVETAAARTFAQLLVATSNGMSLMARASHSLEAYDAMARSMVRQAGSLPLA